MIKINPISTQRLIAHFDLDSFFASVEILNNPALKGLPVIVGGSERGVVTSCSYEARKFGVRSAMPGHKAKQLCPQGIFVKSNYGEYSRYSRWVTKIIAEAAPQFQKASVDEFYIDVTGMDRFFQPLQWVQDLRNKIMADTGLPISFGMGSNKMIAKMATNCAKPNGFLFVQPGKEIDFLKPLKLSAIPGVGKQATQHLANLALYTIGDVLAVGEQVLVDHVGNWGADLWQKCNGRYDGVVEPFHEAKSISSERTFSENQFDLKFLNAELVRLTEKICFELRTDEKKTACVAVKLRYPDFSTHSRQAAINVTDADDQIIPVVKKLFKDLYTKKEPIRLIGVRLSDLKNDIVQASLFEDVQKSKGLYSAIDGVKNRFGKSSVKRASSN